MTPMGQAMHAFVDELQRIKNDQAVVATASKVRDSSTRSCDSSLLRDEEPVNYNPRPGASLENPEVVLGGQN